MGDGSMPIDIHTGKLVEWLISRRHVNRDWPDHVQKVREKINNAIQDMPEHPEIIKLLSGTYINYFHCLKIIDILKETEKDSKNMLGWYGSQRMKDWQEVLHMYEKDNIYLVESAQLLVRNVSFEVPGIKRQMQKCQQIQEECDRKEINCNKNAAVAKDKYYATCKQIGIPGERIKHELIDLLKDLPEEFSKLTKRAQELGNTRQLYLDFIQFTLEDSKTPCLPLLKFVTEHGNVTTYEWIYGEAPIKIELPQVEFNLAEEKDTKEDQIDFGDEGVEIDFGVTDTIDFSDIDSGGADLETGDIDWGNLTTEDTGATIDWGVGESDGDIATVDIVLEESGVEGGVAKGSEALSVLHNSKTRNQFIDELMELECFLMQRSSELDSEGSVLSMNQFSGAPQSVQYHNKKSVSTMLDLVRSLIADFTSTKMQHLYLISDSPRYVDRLSESLRAKQSVSDKLLSSVSTIQSRKMAAQEECTALAPKLQLIIQRTKELQTSIQEHISKKYKNRPVNLMGGVNTL